VQVPTEATLPVDISAFSAFPAEGECVYAPGVHLEQRKEELEFLSAEVNCKVVEVMPSNVGAVGRKLKAGGGAAAHAPKKEEAAAAPQKEAEAAAKKE